MQQPGCACSAVVVLRGGLSAIIEDKEINDRYDTTAAVQKGV
jgi:hypothetical protein